MSVLTCPVPDSVFKGRRRCRAFCSEVRLLEATAVDRFMDADKKPLSLEPVIDQFLPLSPWSTYHDIPRHPSSEYTKVSTMTPSDAQAYHLGLNPLRALMSDDALEEGGGERPREGQKGWDDEAGRMLWRMDWKEKVCRLALLSPARVGCADFALCSLSDSSAATATAARRLAARSHGCNPADDCRVLQHRPPEADELQQAHESAHCRADCPGPDKEALLVARRCVTSARGRPQRLSTDH